MLSCARPPCACATARVWCRTKLPHILLSRYFVDSSTTLPSTRDTHARGYFIFKNAHRIRFLKTTLCNELKTILGQVSGWRQEIPRSNTTKRGGRCQRKPFFRHPPKAYRQDFCQKSPHSHVLVQGYIKSPNARPFDHRPTQSPTSQLDEWHLFTRRKDIINREG